MGQCVQFGNSYTHAHAHEGKTDYLGRSFDGIYAGNYFTILIIASYNSIKWWTPPPPD